MSDASEAAKADKCDACGGHGQHSRPRGDGAGYYMARCDDCNGAGYMLASMHIDALIDDIERLERESGAS